MPPAKDLQPEEPSSLDRGRAASVLEGFGGSGFLSCVCNEVDWRHVRENMGLFVGSTSEQKTLKDQASIDVTF